jgi:Tol biopolymer transport system component
LDTALDQVNWDLSPDGTRVAVVLADSEKGARIRTRPVAHGPAQDVTVPAGSALQSIDWSADGQGWYVSSASAEGARILYVDERGQARTVKQQPRSFGSWAIPSPDGKRLAIVEWSAAQNVWMMER